MDWNLKCHPIQTSASRIGLLFVPESGDLVPVWEVCISIPDLDFHQHFHSIQATDESEAVNEALGQADDAVRPYALAWLN